MTSDEKDRESKEVRMELKYCERCGGLWVREGGGGVYCEKCRSQVADLPIPKKKSGRISLPVQRKSIVGGQEAMLYMKKPLKCAAVGGAA
jgi:hypothetical protein